MEILDLRHFSSTDLRPLLDRESQLWARQLSWDYSGSAEMILRYMDAKILPGYAAVNNGRVLGYAFYVYEGSKGVIGDLYVNGNGNHGNGNGARATEERLLRHVIETLQNSPGIHRIEAQLLLHEAGAQARCFAEQGFRRYARLFMGLPLGGFSGSLEEMTGRFPDLEITRWSESDFQVAAATITAAYREHVDSEINDQYRTLAGSLRFLNNIVRFPGCGTFDPEASLVVRSRVNRVLIGLILCSRVRNDVGHVTQVCLLPEHRRRGLGKALLRAAAGELRKRNCSSLTLTVTENNASAVDLYRKMGFSVHRVFDAFVWEE